MSDAVDHYDLEAAIRNSESRMRGAIDNAVRDACKQLRAEHDEAIRELREQIADALVNRGTLA